MLSGLCSLVCPLVSLTKCPMLINPLFACCFASHWNSFFLRQKDLSFNKCWGQVSSFNQKTVGSSPNLKCFQLPTHGVKPQSECWLGLSPTQEKVWFWWGCQFPVLGAREQHGYGVQKGGRKETGRPRACGGPFRTFTLCQKKWETIEKFST